MGLDYNNMGQTNMNAAAQMASATNPCDSVHQNQSSNPSYVHITQLPYPPIVFNYSPENNIFDPSYQISMSDCINNMEMENSSNYEEYNGDSTNGELIKVEEDEQGQMRYLK